MLAWDRKHARAARLRGALAARAKQTAPLPTSRFHKDFLICIPRQLRRVASQPTVQIISCHLDDGSA
jgi:hypothetical protein